MPLRTLPDPEHLPALDKRFIYQRPATGLTILTRPHAAQLVDRYSERQAAALKRDPTTDRSAITAPPKRPSA